MIDPLPPRIGMVDGSHIPSEIPDSPIWSWPRLGAASSPRSRPKPVGSHPPKESGSKPSTEPCGARQTGPPSARSSTHEPTQKTPTTPANLGSSPPEPLHRRDHRPPTRCHHLYRYRCLHHLPGSDRDHRSLYRYFAAPIRGFGHCQHPDRCHGRVPRRTDRGQDGTTGTTGATRATRRR